MKRILILLAAIAVAGCAAVAPQPQPVAGNAATRLVAVATLATNSCEITTAPAYTAVIVLANNAAARVRAGAISADTATFVLNQGVAAREALDTACKGGQLNQAAFDRAQQAIRVMQGALQ